MEQVRMFVWQLEQLILHIRVLNRMKSLCVDSSYQNKRYNCGSFLAVIHNRSLFVYNTILDNLTVFTHVWMRLRYDRIVI